MQVVETISKIAGRQVELTIRGERNFTFSFDDVDLKAANAIAEFFKGQGRVKIETDDECGTFIYLDA
ncbi:MAG TPA: hypothetical protein VHQ92_13365 [Pseudolabrys sp.]|jgi:hypothetical protein|nr:hypothetical protein [Pseudolabrys sp.]